jgi:DNA-binding LytR/AlgR family response regulator
VGDPDVHHDQQVRVLVVDDEAPARDELAFMLAHDPRVESVRSVGSAAAALKALAAESVDIVFCDIKMPGLDGIELARIAGRFTSRPRFVFVTAYDDRAVDAFDLEAVDYVMKPMRAERVAEALRRAIRSGRADTEDTDDETIPVELAGVTRFVRRSQVHYVEAHGDYTRLHTATGNHLVRTPLSTFEERWSRAGFVRIHRSTLVCLAHVDEVRSIDGRMTVVLGDEQLPVSRRHARDLRDRLSAHRLGAR